MNSKTILTALGLVLALTACNDIVDYNDGYTPADQVANEGAPVIEAVYDIQDTACTTPITEGRLGQMVTIVGKNLNNVQRIAFNTVECDLKEAYTQSSRAIVRIPATLSMEQNNTIEYSTDRGSTSFGFVIPFPALTIGGLDNEFAWAGDSVTIYGENFDLYGFDSGTSKVTINGTALGVGSITSGSMKAAIPTGTPDNSEIVVSWTATDGAKTATLPFRPTSLLLFGNYADVQINKDGSIQQTIEEVEGLTAIHVTGSYSAWAWNTLDLSCNMIDGVSVDSPDNYVLKFEVLNATNFPLTDDIGLQFSFNWGAAYAWSPADGQGINTFGQWKTVALPLAAMATNGIKQPGEWQAMRIIFQPHAAYTADYAITNFRIVKK